MTEIVIPPDIVPSEESIDLIDDATAVFRPIFGSGLVQRVQQAAPRFRVTQKWRGLRAEDRSRMLAVCAALKGKYNTVRAAVAYAMRGSMAVAEVLSNPDFSNGTTGWATGSETDLSVAGQIMLCTRSGQSISQPLLTQSSPVTVTDGVPYCVRAGVGRGHGIAGTKGLYFGATTSYEYGRTTTEDFELMELSGVPYTTSAYATFSDEEMSGSQAGDFAALSVLSLARCLRVDRRSNQILYSDAFTNGAWTTGGLTPTDTTIEDPEGNSTADTFNEGTSTGTHYIVQTIAKSAVNEQWTGVLYAKANTCSTLRAVIGDNGSNYAAVTYNISTGAVVSAASASGTVTYARSSIVDMGNGWFRISLTALIPSSITSTNRLAIYMTSGASTSYTGTSRTCYVWRAGYDNNALPFQPLQTTSAWEAGDTIVDQMLVAGGPASTSGILLPGDFFTVEGQLQIVESPVSTDASGCARVSFTPGLAATPARFSGIELYRPMPRMILVDNPKWTNQYGVYADLELTFETIYEP